RRRPFRRPPGGGVQRRDAADPPHPRAAAPRPRRGDGGGVGGHPRLERRHPARRGAEGVPRPVRAAWPGARLDRRHRVGRLGARRRGAARRADGAAAPPRAPGGVGEPAQGASGLRAADRGDGRGAPVRRRLHVRAQPRGAGGAGPHRGRCGERLKGTPLRGGHMRDVLGDIAGWYESGETFGLATVVHTFRSAPRPPGAAMAVSPGGEVAGSVSGGCVEGAVYDLAQTVMETGRPVLQRYGVSDDDAFSVGLTCGGILDVLVEPVGPDTFPEFPEVAASIERHEPVAVATVVAGPGRIGARRVVWPDRASGSLAPGAPHADRLDAAGADDARGMLAQGLTGQRHYGAEGERRLDDLTVFVHSFAPPPRLLVFGAIDFAGAVARIGKFLGYHVTVCDARPVFATRKRFPDADEVVVKWPHKFLQENADAIDERTAICVLTHDPKFDVPLLEVALRTGAGY